MIVLLAGIRTFRLTALFFAYQKYAKEAASDSFYVFR